MSDVLSETQDEAAYLRCQVQLLTDEVERLRLTNEERTALRVSIQEMQDHTVCGNGYRYGVAATLRGLLERMK